MELGELVATRKWHHKFELAPGLVTPGSYQPAGLFNRLGLASDLTGKRVLDIGARDGYYALRCERAGAEVVAVDNVAESTTGFSIVREVHELAARYIQDDLYNLSAERLGQFDIVLFLGVIYHVPDPCGALEIVRRLTALSGQAFVESTCIDDQVIVAGEAAHDTSPLAHLPMMVYARRNSSSFWDLNSTCLRHLLRDAEFETVRIDRWGRRMLAEARPSRGRHNPVARADHLACGGLH